MKLTKKVIFITDADSGSGKALLYRLADEGAHFILNSVSGGTNLESELQRCQTRGVQVVIVNANLLSSSAVVSVLEDTTKQIGPVDILIHNNRTVKTSSVELCEEDCFLEVLNANAKSAFVCAQAVGKQMIAKQSGTMLFVGSIHAEKPTGSSFSFSVSQGAIKMLSREASLVLGRHGIHVNFIEMGPVAGDDTLFQSDVSSIYEDYMYKVPSNVLGTYDDLAQLVSFLCSDNARHMNGADIRLDGGFLMHYMDHKMKKPPDLEV
ncbi:SDR family NAD(P)-dependent oxidoreductase [Paenibacillus sp. GCM10023248]|uniref:SDR family NAD(P)-dependent oxidoreductase n=1 Tax=unclassified Paenibacillus TaxID=185978 RepID=UPI002378AF22|nr:SDR family oxidoreductase [Paenibacillus sp. MAHUQ-63]MDD9268542.1 SDR family NAD(P)-dependent oxidoreductase [Paenibacillus sp. MAHUQ-63]